MNEIVLGITTYNRLDILKKSIASLKSSKIPKNCKIRIYDDCSPDYGREELVELIPEAEVIYIQSQNRGSDGNIWTMYNDFVQRNKSGDVLVNCDSDLIYNNNWLYDALEALKKTDGVLSVFNTNNHQVINDLGEFVSKKDIGSAGTLFKYEIVQSIIDRFPDICLSAFDYKWCDFLQKKGIQLLCTRESLVQHIGIDGFNSDISSFDYGIGFKVDTRDNGQIINDIIENYVKSTKKNARRFWYALFPFNLIDRNSKIVLYGAGEVAKDYLHQIKCNKYCEIVAVIDTYHAGENIILGKNDAITIASIDYLIHNDNFDKIVISVRDQDIASCIKDVILSYNPSVASKLVYAGQECIIRL